jgi:hypothetical protein
MPACASASEIVDRDPRLLALYVGEAGGAAVA